MKSNFFKIVLPAFALMLAITASLAFTPNASEDLPVKIILTASDMTKGFWDDNGAAVVIPSLLRPITCDTEGTVPCTVIIPNEGIKEIYLYEVNVEVNGIVSVLLYKPEE